MKGSAYCSKKDVSDSPIVQILFQIAKAKTFVQIMRLKFTFLTSDDIKNYY